MILLMILIYMITDGIVTDSVAGQMLSNSVAPTVRHVRVSPGHTQAVTPAVGPHHRPIGQECLSPELTSWIEIFQEMF